ncbi:MAG: type II toxin-antitoxin system Phd/YefM family antitoxin [Anaerolineae bacterium]|jgi:prevent-host-death family protein|nr:type II toxin-antitoxin system Phd/YefM family antitoxin [Anaerolineae bacterium]MDH7474463.1 type II toxin-antitoxin system Phd/YefM family antitoxin [Anaerolineae bacterium]
MTVRVSIAEARGSFSKLLRHAREGPVIITRRGKPDAVILPFGEYERLRRQRGYSNMVRLSRELAGVGVTATELDEASRKELDERLWSS